MEYPKVTHKPHLPKDWGTSWDAGRCSFGNITKVSWGKYGGH